MNIVQDMGGFRAQFEEIINKGIDKTRFAEVVSDATPGTEYAIEHGLRTIPIGFIVVSQDKAAVTYNGATVWDREKIYLKTNLASVSIRILIF